MVQGEARRDGCIEARKRAIREEINGVESLIKSNEWGKNERVARVVEEA